MSEKYLGETFDIHGGGLDLLFPHHECEIAQSVAAQGHETVNYWVHNNMIAINGKKMGKAITTSSNWRSSSTALILFSNSHTPRW